MIDRAKRRARCAVGASIGLALGLLGGQPAHADEPKADCEVHEIQAHNGEGGIDPALKPLARKLQKPPFSGWKSFRLLAKHELALTQKQPAGLGLATGGKMTLLYREKVEAKGKKPRLRLSVNLDDAKGKRTLDATTLVDSGDVWLIGGEPMAGEKNPDATYVVAIACALK
jgi:hypothetical protein